MSSPSYKRYTNATFVIVHAPITSTCMLTTAKTQDLAFRRGGPGLTPSTTQCAGFRSIPWIHLPRQDSKSLRAHRRLRPAQGSLHALLWRFLQLQVPFHHLVDKLGTELGYLMSKDTGYDVEDCITLATKGLKLRVARRVWRDYYY